MSSSMRLRSLRIWARTNRGTADRSIEFSDGLNLLRADNSSGKSTALQSIVYALGLEGMLSPSHRIPLPHAMTDSINLRGIEETVLESGVELEVSNALGEVVRVSRYAKHATKKTNLVEVESLESGRSLRSSIRSRSFFVRQPGAAQNEAGFHRFLADFLGLKLARVTKLDGSEGLLYLETIFPYFFVEQKHGWSGIQARTPTYLGIRDVGKRSAEYVLGMESLGRIVQRQRVRSNMSELESSWQTSMAELSESARLTRVLIQHAPSRISRYDKSNPIQAIVEIDGSWRTLSYAAQAIRSELANAESQPIPSAGESAGDVEQNLHRVERALQRELAVYATVSDERQELERQNEQVVIRLDALREDLQRHKDTRVLERLGAEQAHLLLADSICPTCRQHLDDGSDISPHAMTVAESIKFIEDQIVTFESVLNDQKRVIEAIRSRERSIEHSVRDYRSEIRAARDTLSSASGTPSVATIARRIRLEERASELENAESVLERSISEIEQIYTDWVKQRDFLKTLEKDDLTDSDKSRIDRVQSSVRAQLVKYGFRSLPPYEVEIDERTYRPVHEGFDLGFDISASDMIRLIWSYLFAVMEVGRESDGNHLGLLIFDEPRQQDTARESYNELLSHAASVGERGAQVLFATSEPLDSLKEMLGDRDVNLISLDSGEKLLV